MNPTYLLTLRQDDEHVQAHPVDGIDFRIRKSGARGRWAVSLKVPDAPAVVWWISVPMQEWITCRLTGAQVFLGRGEVPLTVTLPDGVERHVAAIHEAPPDEYP